MQTPIRRPSGYVPGVGGGLVSSLGSGRPSEVLHIVRFEGRLALCVQVRTLRQSVARY